MKNNRDINLEFKDNIYDDIGWEYMSCFIRPLCMELERSKKVNSKFFVVLFYLFKSFPNMGSIYYNYKESKITSYLSYPNKDNELNIINYILENYFGCRLKKILAEGQNLYSIIELNTLNEMATLVPVNPKYMFYSDYYKEKDWIHWLYCTGINKDKNIVYIKDHVQFGMTSTRYRPFILTKDLLDYFHNAFLLKYPQAPDKKYIYVIEPLSDPIIYNTESFVKILKNYLSDYVNGKKLTSIELDAYNNEDFASIFTFKHLKTIYNKYLSEILNVNNLNVNDIKNNWDEIAKKIMFNNLRKKEIDKVYFDSLIALNLERESNYFNDVLDVIDSNVWRKK